MAEEYAGGRARQKPMFTGPIIRVILIVLAPSVIFLLTSDVGFPRIRIEYARHGSDSDPDVPARAPANIPPPEAAVAAVHIEQKRRVEQQPAIPPVRPQTDDRPYSLGPAVPYYDALRAAWLAAHPGFPAYVARDRPRVMVVTGSSPHRCSDPEGDRMLLRAFKNKADYCRVHGFDIFYSNAVLDAEMSGFWTKLPLLRALMVAHPEMELFWWVDSDVVFTDMLFEPPWGKYAGHNLLIPGWESKVYEEKSWMGTNAGSFVIRNCQWSLNLLDAWAEMGRSGPVREKYGKIFAKVLSNRAPYEADDQSALVYLLVTQRERWADRVFLESSYVLHGYWKAIVDKYEDMRSNWQPGLGDDRWPLITHFVGCKPCGDPNGASYEAAQCWRGIDRAFNFADDQILKLYGFQHESLNSTAVQRVRNETGRPMDTDDEEIGRLLHPTFRAARKKVRKRSSSLVDPARATPEGPSPSRRPASSPSLSPASVGGHRRAKPVPSMMEAGPLSQHVLLS